MRRLAPAFCLALAACSDCGKPSDSGPKDVDVPEVTSIKVPGDAAAVVNATPLPTASVAAMLNPEAYPAYEGPTGSVEGIVTVTGDPPVPTPADFTRCPDAEKIWGASFREGAAGPKGRPLADAIVGVTGYKGVYVQEKNEAKRIVIEGCGFTQRTVTLTFGQELDVLNKSRDFWTPSLEPGVNLVWRMATPNGDPIKLYPKRPGHFLLLDHDRHYAVADVYVFLHPLHTNTDFEGHYRIDGLPVGKLKLSTTHPRFEGETSVDLDVRANVVAKVDLTLKHVHRDAGPAILSSDAGGSPVLR